MSLQLAEQFSIGMDGEDLELTNTLLTNAEDRKNKLLEKVIRDKNIIVLKMKVQEAGLLWGITDIEEVTKLAKRHRIDPKTLQGQYGKQINK